MTSAGGVARPSPRRSRGSTTVCDGDAATLDPSATASAAPWQSSLADSWTTSEDAEHSRPEPDIVATALSRVNGAQGVMAGDSTWDAVAAGKLSIPTISVRTGGFSVEELHEAGAVAVFDLLGELRDRLDDTPLARPG